MIYAKNLVNSYTIIIIVEVCNYFGLSVATRNAIISVFTSIMQGMFADVATIALLPIVYIYQNMGGVNVSIPSWISDGVDYLINVIRPNFDWVIDGINNWWAFWDNRSYYIKRAVDAAYGNLQTFIDKVMWLWNNGQSVISSISSNAQQWILDRLPASITNVVTWLNNNKGAISNFISNALQFALQIAANPAQVIYNFIPQWLRDAATIIKSDMGYFAWLANEGKRLIVSFFSNPQEFIKANVIDNLLDWLIDKINEAW